jgi:ABC-type transporter Mla maintaining outer membrane lipid asymmetry ATPase subunit MlaF
MPNLIELRDVTVTAGAYEILKNVSAVFPEGGSTMIMGPSGCGKSTLLKVAAGLIPPDRGSVFYRGEDLYWLSERKLRELRKTNGFVFQDSALWENKTIFDNLALPLQVHHPEMDGRERENRVARMLERGGLIDSLRLRPSQISGGERKIVSFLRAAIVEPSLIFLDSPTEMVDAAMTERITAMIRDLKGQGCSILAVSHDRKLASTLADRLVVMHGGSLAAEGDFDSVKRSPDPRVRAVLSEVLGEIASFDTDLLTLLDGEGEN